MTMFLPEWLASVATTCFLSSPVFSTATHVTGRSVFLDDVLSLTGESMAAIVSSPAARHQEDRLSVACKVPGVAAVLCGGSAGPVVQDEMLLADKEVVFIGQLLPSMTASPPSRSTCASRRARCVMTAYPANQFGFRK